MTEDHPIAYRMAKVPQVFPIGRTKLYELVASGEIASFKVGRSRFISRQALLDFCQRATAD
jgi:excisionase family DNA binding protein